jgi:hypothetical protein
MTASLKGMAQITRNDTITTKLTVAMMKRSLKIQRISEKWRKVGPAPIPLHRQNVHKQKQQHGITLEHAVSMTILSTASSGPENAHFVVNDNRMIHAYKTPRSILLDLTHAENLRTIFASNRKAVNKIATTRHPACKTNKKENLPPNLRPSLKTAETHRYTRTREDSSRLALSVNHSKPTEKQDDRRRSNSQVGAVYSFNPLLPREEELVLHHGLMESFDSISWGDGENTPSVAMTFMTESDAWTSLCSHTYHMGRRKTTIDHDGFPRFIST